MSRYGGKLSSEDVEDWPEVQTGGGLSDGDKVDITVSASGATWTINTSVVTTAKMGGDVTAAGKALLDDADAAAQRTTLGAAATSHGHAIADSTGLQSALDGKAASSHGHAQADVTDLVTDLAGKAASSHSHGAGDLPSLSGLTAPSGSVNFNDQQATSFRVENRTSDPGTPTVGQIWVRTDL